MASNTVLEHGLKKVALFKDLSDLVLKQIAAEMSIKDVAANQKVVEKGAIANEMFFLLSGTVKVIGGDGKVIDTAGPGSFFGELALVYDVPRQASVVTVEDCQLAVLSKAHFNDFKSEHPTIIEAIKRIADERFEKFRNFLRTQDVGDRASFTEEQINTFRQVFADVDGDRSGHIDADELADLFVKLSGKKPSPSDLKKFMSYIDSDKNGKIDFDEFLNGLPHFAWLVTPAGSDKPAAAKSKSLLVPVVIAVAVIGAVGFAVYKNRASRK